MTRIFIALTCFLAVSSAEAGRLSLKISNGAERDCGSIIQVTNSNSQSALVSSADCTCSINRPLSISDTMELVRSDARLVFVCESDRVDMGDQFAIERGVTASMSTNAYSIRTFSNR